MHDNMPTSNCNSTITKLPIYHPSPVIVYLDYAQYLSIILSNNNNFDWYISNFIHYYVHLKEKEHLFDFYYPQVIGWQDTLPLRVYKINEKVFGMNKINIVEDTIQWINNGYYVRLEINEKNITGTQIDFDFIHPIFIYGYDKENHTFYSFNFDKENTFSLIQIPFADIEESFYSKTTSSLISTTHYTSVSEDSNEYLITLYKMRDSQCSLNINQMIKDIQLYADGTNVSTLYSSQRVPVDADSFWGINIYKGITQYLESFNSTDKIDYRVFHGLWEHKKIMLTRLNYLKEKGLLKSGTDIPNKFSEIENMSAMLRMIILKYNFSRKKELIHQSIHLTNDICLAERSVLEILLNELEMNNNKE